MATLGQAFYNACRRTLLRCRQVGVAERTNTVRIVGPVADHPDIAPRDHPIHDDAVLKGQVGDHPFQQRGGWDGAAPFRCLNDGASVVAGLRRGVGNDPRDIAQRCVLVRVVASPLVTPAVVPQCHLEIDVLGDPAELGLEHLDDRALDRVGAVRFAGGRGVVVANGAVLGHEAKNQQKREGGSNPGQLASLHRFT